MTNSVRARVTVAKQLTLPDDLLTSFPGVDCFEASVEDDRIVLTPVERAIGRGASKDGAAGHHGERRAGRGGVGEATRLSQPRSHPLHHHEPRTPDLRRARSAMVAITTNPIFGRKLPIDHRGVVRKIARIFNEADNRVRRSWCGEHVCLPG